MDADLEALWSKLNLTEEEEEGILVSQDEFYDGFQWIPNCLIGYLLTRKKFNKEAFKSTKERIWRSTPLKAVKEVGNNLFMFQFRYQDRQIVLNGGPWNFEDQLVLLKELEKRDRPGKDLITQAAFWVQVYNLPFVSMTEKVGYRLGKRLGQVQEIRTDEEGIGLGSCLLIRAVLDTRKPLKRRLKISVEEENDIWVDLKYERLPTFCYCCGVIGHTDNKCPIAIRLKNESRANILQYGSWLKAPPRQKGSRSNFTEEAPPRTTDRRGVGGERKGKGTNVISEANGVGVALEKAANVAATINSEVLISDLSDKNRCVRAVISDKPNENNHDKGEGEMISYKPHGPSLKGGLSQS